MGTVHAQFQRALVHRLRVTSVPAIVVVIDGKVRHYTGKLAIPELRKYFRTLVPASLITQVGSLQLKCFVSVYHYIF